MKFSIIIQAVALALFSHLVYATAIDTRAVAGTNHTQNFEDLVAYQLPDGRRRIDFYDNGALEGYAIETDAGGKSLSSPRSQFSLGFNSTTSYFLRCRWD